MNSPEFGALTGYATKEAASEAWANIKDNNELVIYEVYIGLGSFRPAESPVTYVILRKLPWP